MRKLLLKCGYSLGDIVMLTTAVRDLHRCHPGVFATDVRTWYPALWENNPYLTKLADDDPEVESLECTYPLIDRCNRTPYHCLHGFIEFFNERLKLGIKPTAFKGDIHLSAQERAWYSQVHELTGENTPFWIVAAGGKYDVTIKWWESRRYQAVIDHFRGRIQFVQVGSTGHYHPKLDGVIDLRGKTTCRELIRLVHHAQGLLCPVTGLMHLAAAVETRPGRPPNRPCVVVAGGREPAHWEAYPDHQFIHTNGVLPCGAGGGCWKDRTTRLRDGDFRDRSLCVNVVEELPRCMDMITPEDVIRRIEKYFEGGSYRYLSSRQRLAAAGGVAATASNPFDGEPLNLGSAGAAMDRFVKNLAPYPGGFEGRGIVICGGGVTYFTNAWACINLLRHLGCRLPIEFWHLGAKELDAGMRSLLAPLRVECIDALKVRRRHPARILNGWELKPYAVIHSHFREVLLLDADNMPVMNPEFLFDTPQYRDTGAIFWPDYPLKRSARSAAIWRSCGLRQPNEPEFETGQILLDKQRCWAALCLTMWLNENSDFYYRYVHGDKETFHLAFRKLKKSYSLVRKGIYTLATTMCQHDFTGRRIFQHRSRNKWDFFLHNKMIRGFRFEKECRSYLIRLQEIWDGGLRLARRQGWLSKARQRKNARPGNIEAVVYSFRGLEAMLRRSLDNLAKTDWGSRPHSLLVEAGENVAGANHANALRQALELALDLDASHILLLQGNSDFNQHLRHNLIRWQPVNAGTATWAGLHNPRLRDRACDIRNHARIIDPASITHSQAFLFSKATICYVLRQWPRPGESLEAKLRRLARDLGKAIFFHAPSLVRACSKPAGTMDFDPNWIAR